MSNKIIHAKNSTLLWHNTLSQTQKNMGISMDQEMNQYLIMSIQSNLNKPEIISTIVSTELAKLQQTNQGEKIRQLADLCLIFTGLIINEEHFLYRYYTQLGKDAFLMLVNLYKRQASKLSDYFEHIHDHFDLMQKVLQSISKKDKEMHESLNDTDHLNLLSAYYIQKKKA
jgi:hypothetical protein